jgi:hypothetical protein
MGRRFTSSSIRLWHATTTRLDQDAAVEHEHPATRGALPVVEGWLGTSSAVAIVATATPTRSTPASRSPPLGRAAAIAWSALQATIEFPGHWHEIAARNALHGSSVSLAPRITRLAYLAPGPSSAARTQKVEQLIARAS